RETWRAEELATGEDGIRFRADDAFARIENTLDGALAWLGAWDGGRYGEKWRPSILMPRWASRILLDVISIRVERVQEISEEDIAAEGVTRELVAEMARTPLDEIPDLRAAWRIGWIAINGRESWEANPWVWVIGFRRTEEASHAR